MKLSSLVDIDFLKSALADSDITEFTPVQQKTIPLIRKRKDVIVQAPTGSGKTLAYLLPLIELLLKREEFLKPQEVGALIIVPARELALQVYGVLSGLLKHQPSDGNQLSSVRLSGGQALTKDVTALQSGCNILVATPGRLMALLAKSDLNMVVKMKSLEILILDEADRLLEMGFRDKLAEILNYVPKQRRTGLFSATQATEVEDLARAGLRDPVRIVVMDRPKLENSVNQDTHATESEVMPQNLKCYYSEVAFDSKFHILLNFLKCHVDSKTVVFFSSAAAVEYFKKCLSLFEPFGLKQKLISIHRKKQNKRENAFETFRKAEVKSGRGIVMLCTDVLARGIDIPDIDWIVQCDLPRNARCGRTARLGRPGNAIIFLYPSEVGYVEFLQKNQGVKVINAPVESSEVFRNGTVKNDFVGDVAKTVARLRKEAKKDRSFLVKGTHSFISYVQSYVKHDVQMLCGLNDLELGLIGNGFGLLRLPKIKEFHRLKTEGFERSDIDTSKIKFLDRKMENERAEKQKVKQEEKFEQSNARKRKKLDKKKSKKRIKIENQVFTDKDLNEINADYKEMKNEK